MATVASIGQYTLDTLLQLEDGAALIAADGDGSAILDLGAAAVWGDVVIDVSAIEVATTDEQYVIHVQLSDSATFASGIEVCASLQLGAVATGALGQRDVVSTTGRYVVPVTNQMSTRQYRYMQLYVDVSGTIATGIMFTAYLCKSRS
jgi:hypothetical protein